METNILNVRRRVRQTRGIVFEKLMEEAEKADLTMPEIILVVSGLLNELASDAVRMAMGDSETEPT